MRTSGALISGREDPGRGHGGSATTAAYEGGIGTCGYNEYVNSETRVQSSYGHILNASLLYTQCRSDDPISLPMFKAVETALLQGASGRRSLQRLDCTFSAPLPLTESETQPASY